MHVLTYTYIHSNYANFHSHSDIENYIYIYIGVKCYHIILYTYIFIYIGTQGDI